MLFFIAHQEYGFVVRKDGIGLSFSKRVRMAMPFDSFESADRFAKENKLGSWAILSNCIG